MFFFIEITVHATTNRNNLSCLKIDLLNIRYQVHQPIKMFSCPYLECICDQNSCILEH